MSADAEKLSSKWLIKYNYLFYFKNNKKRYFKKYLSITSINFKLMKVTGGWLIKIEEQAFIGLDQNTALG